MKKATLLSANNAVKEDNSIHGIANSLTKTRSGITVTEEAGKKVVGQLVPLLMAHDWGSLPIGTAKMTGVDENGLSYEGNIFESVSDREQILEGIKAGVLAVSIGFGLDEIEEDGSINDIDLLELSLTPVPADAKATVTQSLKFEEGNILKNKTLATDPNATPADNSTTDPTIQDVLDAIKSLASDVSDIKDAVVKPDDGESNGNGETATADDSATQSLKEANTKLLAMVEGMELSFSNMIKLKNIKKSLDTKN